GLRPWRNPREAPTRNSTLKACHIANMKDDFHCKATENGQLSIGDRLLFYPQMSQITADFWRREVRPVYFYSGCLRLWRWSFTVKLRLTRASMATIENEGKERV
ncbi:MAG: hypothetical protein ACOX9E_08090, partial [Lentisphaeria bacterium]